MNDELKKIPMFAELGENVIDELEKVIATRQCKAGEKIFGEGEQGDCMFVVKQGIVEIRKKGRTLSYLHEGAVFGEMALYETAVRSADAIAGKKTVVYELSNDNFRRLVFDFPEGGVHLLYDSVRLLSRRLRVTSEYLTTVFETGRIAGADTGLEKMAQAILKRLLGDIEGSTGGSIWVQNQFTDGFDLSARSEAASLDRDMVEKLIADADSGEFVHHRDAMMAFGVPLVEENHVVGYIVLEKEGEEPSFTTEERVIISAVGNQVGLGIIRALRKKEDEDRLRLEQTRMMNRGLS